MLVKRKFAVFPEKTAGNRRDSKTRTRVDACGTKPGFALLTQTLFSVNVALRVRQKAQTAIKKTYLSQSKKVGILRLQSSRTRNAVAVRLHDGRTRRRALCNNRGVTLRQQSRRDIAPTIAALPHAAIYYYYISDRNSLCCQ